MVKPRTFIRNLSGVVNALMANRRIMEILQIHTQRSRSESVAPEELGSPKDRISVRVSGDQ